MAAKEQTCSYCGEPMGVIEREGRHYRFTAEFHSEEGLQGLYDGPTEVKQVERLVKEWVPA